MTRQELHAYLDNLIDEAEGDNMRERRQVIIAYHDDGKPVYKNLKASSQDEMNIKIVKAFIESGRIWDYMNKPEENEKPGVNMKFYATEWLSRKRKIKKTTLVNYKLYVDSYIIPVLGSKAVNEIKTSDIQKLLDDNKDKAKKTLMEIKACIAQIMKYAVSDGIINRNPCESVDILIPSDKCTEREALPLTEYKDILENMDKLGSQDKVFLALFMYTGMRRGEGLALTWEDIDFNANEIHINRNATYPCTNVPLITTPKTKAGTRTIPLDATLREILLPHRAEGYVIHADDPLKPLTITQLKSIFKRINRTINMHGATLHTIRHSFLTYAVGETTDYKTVQGISGHADVFTLMNRYAHPQQDKMKELSVHLHEILS